MNLYKNVLTIVSCLLLTACVASGNAKFLLKQDFVIRNYPQIRGIVVEEAANNGFGTLTSEVKPSEYNDWTGRLFFQLKTPNGTDQLFVDFNKVDTGVNIWIHGAGTRSNPDSAAKAIQARITQLNDGALKVTSSTRQLTPAPVQNQEKQSAAPAAQAPLQPREQMVNDQNIGSSLSNTEVQQKLIALGYLKGIADGKFGKNSVDALKRFQKASGVVVTGSIDAETITKLKSAGK